MRTAWYKQQGPADEVLVVGKQPNPEPKAGEVRIRVRYSGINPGDVKKRQDVFGYGMPYRPLKTRRKDCKECRSP